jgi:hypothetical protein
MYDLLGPGDDAAIEQSNHSRFYDPVAMLQRYVTS